MAAGKTLLGVSHKALFDHELLRHKANVDHTGPTPAKSAPFKRWFWIDESGKFLKFGHGFERASSSGTRYDCARAYL